jgi:hypothetical protein
MDSPQCGSAAVGGASEGSNSSAQLERLRDGRQPLADPGQAAQADDEFVAQCERIISDQNEAWMAKLSSDPQ